MDPDDPSFAAALKAAVDSRQGEMSPGIGGRELVDRVADALALGGYEVTRGPGCSVRGSKTVPASVFTLSSTIGGEEGL